MRRLNPFGSLLGFLLSILLFLGLGFSLWYNRGLAFNPGPVTSIRKADVSINGFYSHAEFEKECSYCHEPLKTNLANKCIDCHMEINQQIQTGQGIHSQIAIINECASCHPDHRGRDFDPTTAAYQLFDHSTTGFSLNWHQENFDATPMQCSACHKNSEFRMVDYQICTDCHRNLDKNFSLYHVQDFGSNCLGCHDGQDQMQGFDHNQTRFPLVAKHEQIKCTECHINNVIIGTPASCKDCHEEPAMHKGLFEQTCESCHTPDGWSPAEIDDQSFSHFETTGFSLVLHQLDYSNLTITCLTCHPTDLQVMDIQNCIDCHSQFDPIFMKDHLTQFGTGCGVCHDGVDRLSNFDHVNFFPLDGQHALLQCSDCHVENVYRGTPAECWQCHEEPEIHASVFGMNCYFCHGEDVWSPANLRYHIFPVNHGIEKQNNPFECRSCHLTNYIDYTCYKCHEHQQDEMLSVHQEEGISGQELLACASCHPDGGSAVFEGKP